MEPETKKMSSDSSLYFSRMIREATPKQFLSPSAVCYDEVNKRIIVGVSGNRNIQLLDPETLQVQGKFGTRELIHTPLAMCIQPFTRNLIVADFLKNSVLLFDINDSYSCLYKPNISSPTGVCCDEKGNIIMSLDEEKMEVWNECCGTIVRSYEKSGFNPSNVCFDKEHNQLLVVQPDKMSVFSNHSLQLISTIQLPHVPLYLLPKRTSRFIVCMDPFRNHQILVSTRTSKLVFDNRTHKLLQTLERLENIVIYDMCVNEDNGNLIVPGFSTNSIHLFE